VIVLITRHCDDFKLTLIIPPVYIDLPHPPSGYLGLLSSSLSVTPISIAQSRANYAFRIADGSYNNVLLPNLGKAGSPYARSVPSSRHLPAYALPDPGLVFDILLKRDEFVPHPGGVSSLFFAFANLVIHSIFNTNPKDWRVNNASS
jgi:linoleate 10R-lipoxygenase